MLLRRRIGAASILIGFASLAAHAQVAPGGAFEEIVVTARKQPERLQDTPVSITAFTAQAMERLGIESLVDVAKRTPGLQYGDFGDLKLSPTSLRGIVSSAGSAGADPAIGYYVDEVYVGQGPGADLDLYDVERVEVLRGPQGTLFGRNTIGGVINITTKRPTDALEGSASLTLGNYGQRRIGATVSGPVATDLLDARISFLKDERSGYDRNVFLNRRVNDHDTWSLRGQALFKLGPVTELLLQGSYRSADQEPLVFETKRYNSAALLPSLLTSMKLPLNTDPYDRQVIANAISRESLRSSSFAATFKTELGGIKITDVASYHRHAYDDRTDTCRCQLPVSYDGDPENVWRLSNELRAAFRTGPVEWLAGYYFSRQFTDNRSFIELGSTLAAAVGDPSVTGMVIGSNGRLFTTSHAGFASATWKINDRLDLTVGGRYTRDSKSINYTQRDPLFLLGGNAAIRTEDSWGEFTPNANLRYRIAPDVLAYATVSKGFKSGGYNDALGDANGIAFGPETLWNYEAGLKTELFDRRLMLNASVFYMKWSKIQITSQNPATVFFDPIITNAGAAHSEGLELEAALRPDDRWLFAANLSVQRARYDEGKLPTGQALREIPYAPDYTGMISAQYTLPVGGAHQLAFYGEYLLRGRTYLSTNNDPDGLVKPYGLVNLRLSLAPDDNRWRVALWTKNLGNTSYAQRLFDLFDNPFVGQKFIVLGEPRTFGVDFKVNF